MVGIKTTGLSSFIYLVQSITHCIIVLFIVVSLTYFSKYLYLRFYVSHLISLQLKSPTNIILLLLLIIFFLNFLVFINGLFPFVFDGTYATNVCVCEWWRSKTHKRKQQGFTWASQHPDGMNITSIIELVSLPVVHPWQGNSHPSWTSDPSVFHYGNPLSAKALH